MMFKVSTITVILGCAIASVSFADTASVVNSVLGKKLYATDTVLTIKKNGRVTGNVKDQKVTGSWQMKDGLFCRSLKLGGKALGSSCQKLTKVSGGVKLTDVPDAGRKARVYKFKP